MTRLTIGILTYNRAGKLVRLLAALAGELGGSAAGRVSILVSDNCSADDTAAVVAAWAGAHTDQQIDFVRQRREPGRPAQHPDRLRRGARRLRVAIPGQ